jgi:O-acetyl-ADP-ribose deacetylase (regulator of RNase III)
MAANLHIINGDLLAQDVDVIVNAWNRNIIPWWLLLPQGVSGAIKRRAGYAPFRELARKGSIPLGGAVETTAGKLPCKGIIHVAGISLWWRSATVLTNDPILVSRVLDSCCESLASRQYARLTFEFCLTNTPKKEMEENWGFRFNIPRG